MMGSSKPAHKRNKTLRKIPPDERDQALSDSLDNWFIKRVSERRGIIGDGRNGPMVCFAGYRRDDMIETYRVLRPRLKRLQVLVEEETESEKEPGR